MRPSDRSRIAAACHLLLLLAATLLPGSPSSAQDRDEGAREAQAEREPNLPKWRWVVELAAPKEATRSYVAADLTSEVLGKAHFARQDNDDLAADLRIVDAVGRHVPYVPRVLRHRVVQHPVAIARRFDAGPDAAGRYYQVSLELKDVQAPGHSEIAVRTPGRNFRRKVEVQGADDASFKDAQPLLPDQRFLIDYHGADQSLVVDRFDYDFKRFPFLRVRVYADPALGEKPPVIGDVLVRQADRTPGKYVTYPAGLGASQSVYAGDGPGTAWYIELGKERTFCEKLSFEAAPGSPIGVERPFRLQQAEPNEGRVDLGGIDARWRRDGERDFLDLSFAEVYATRLRFVVTDYANAPLQFAKAEATMAARQVVFETPKADAWPLKLYFGNREARPANYDLRQKLPLHFEPALAAVGSRKENPAYQPPPRRVEERYPWLVYLVLSIACVFLAGLLLPLARQALRQGAEASG